MTGDGSMGAFDLLLKIFNDEGIQGLFKGGSVRMMYMCVGGFAYFGIYEQIKSVLTKCLFGEKKKV